MRYSFLIIPLFFIFLSQSCFALEVSFKADAEVVTNSITLGDVVSFSDDSSLAQALATKIIGTSPEPGQKILLISKNIIKSIYRKNSLTDPVKWVGSATVSVIRRGQKIEPHMLTQAVSDFLLENKNELPQAEISFVAESLPLPFMVPVGQISWEILPSNPDILHSSRFSIILRVDGRVRKNLSLPGHVKAIAPVAVASANLPRGAILTPANTFMEKRNLALLKDPCLTTRTLFGKRLKHAVRAGNAIHSSYVESPPLVQKGQLVKIILNNGPLFLSATGIARMSGKRDEIIRVQNSSSNKMIFCKITAPGIVEVQI